MLKKTRVFEIIEFDDWNFRTRIKNVTFIVIEICALILMFWMNVFIDCVDCALFSMSTTNCNTFLTIELSLNVLEILLILSVWFSLSWKSTTKTNCIALRFFKILAINEVEKLWLKTNSLSWKLTTKTDRFVTRFCNV